MPIAVDARNIDALILRADSVHLVLVVGEFALFLLLTAFA